MLKKTITYTDYNGEEKTKDFYFNLNQAELSEMELTTPGGLTNYLHQIIGEANIPEIFKFFKRFILASYGVKSPDGESFMKDGGRLGKEFMETDAYSVLFMELATDAKAAADFVNAVIPSSLVDKNKPTLEN